MPTVKHKSPSERTRRRRAPEDTRRRLVEAAWPVFARKGFRAASIEEIAKAAGLTRGAFHWHFESKEDLLIATLELHRERENEAARRRTEGAGSPEDLTAAVHDELAAQRDDDRRWKQLLSLEALLYGARNPEARERLAAMKRSGMEVIAERARLYGDDLVLSVEDVTALFQAVNDGLAMQDLFFGEERFRERYERLFPVLLAAVTKRAGSSRRRGRRSARE